MKGSLLERETASGGGRAPSVARWGVALTGATAVAIGAVFLLAWHAGWVARWSARGMIVTKTNMALGLVVGGAALLLLGAGQPSRRRRVLATVAASLVFLLGALTLAEHVFGWDLRLDQLLATERPGALGTASPNRLGPPGSLSLTLLGAALLCLSVGRRRFVPYLGVAIFVVNLLPAVGFLYGVPDFYGRVHLTGIAWPTVVALLSLGAGLFCAHPEGPLGLLLRDDPGGVLLRRLFPAALLIPLVLGFVRTAVEGRGLLGAAAARGGLVIALIVVFSALLWRSAAQLSRAAAAQRRSEEAVRTAALFPDENPSPVLRVSRDGVLLYANPASAELLARWECKVGGPVPPELVRIVSEVLGAKRAREINVDLRGEVQSLHVVPVAGDNHANLYGRDITQRLRAEAELKEASRRKDEFLALLAHELRNPLAPVLNAVEILRRAGENRELHTKAEAIIERQVHQMARLIDDLLDISRIAQGKITIKKQRVPLATIIQNAVETSRPLVDQAGHELAVRLPETPLFVEADPIRIGQVVSNLLSNAAKYTFQRGRIELSGEADGDEAVVRVRDTGIGIQPDLLTRIFDLFVQVDSSLERARGGLGVGLALAKSLVELHGGRIEARSAGLGQGSEFVVRLPRASAEVAAEPARRPAPAPEAGLQVLIVDDNADVAESMALLLEMAGHRVQTALDGPAALELARRHRPDLVLLDIGMPSMNGYEVAARLRESPETRGARLVAMTGWGQDEDRRRAEEAGFDHHLTKPAAFDDIQALLGNARSMKAR